MSVAYRNRGMKASFRLPAPAHLTVRDTIRRHMHEAGRNLDSLSAVWGCKKFSVWRAFQRIDRPLQPHQVEGVIETLHLDEFDANDLRLQAAREAGWKIDPQYLEAGE